MTEREEDMKRRAERLMTKGWNSPDPDDWITGVYETALADLVKARRAGRRPWASASDAELQAAANWIGTYVSEEFY